MFLIDPEYPIKSHDKNNHEKSLIDSLVHHGIGERGAIVKNLKDPRENKDISKEQLLANVFSYMKLAIDYWIYKNDKIFNNGWIINPMDKFIAKYNSENQFNPITFGE